MATLKARLTAGETATPLTVSTVAVCKNSTINIQHYTVVTTEHQMKKKTQRLLTVCRTQKYMCDLGYLVRSQVHDTTDGDIGTDAAWKITLAAPTAELHTHKIG